MARELEVVRALCASCAVCVDLCPDVFELDEDGIAVVVNSSGDSESAIHDAIEACPEGAIRWHEIRSRST